MPTVNPRAAQIAKLSPEAYSELEALNLQKLEALPNVSKASLQVGSRLNQTTVRAALTCGKHWYLQCGAAQQKTRCAQHCSGDIPTAAHAAEVLMARLTTDHGKCIEYLTRQDAGSTAGTSTFELATCAFNRMSQVQRLASEASAAKTREEEAHQMVERARTAELRAVQKREAVEASLRELRAKRQRIDDAAQVEAGAEAADGEPAWKGWTVSRWRKHETEAQARRSVAIDITNSDSSPPPRGDEVRGWRWHWRRGLVGSIQDWAEGSIGLEASRGLHAGRDGRLLRSAAGGPPASTPTARLSPLGLTLSCSCALAFLYDLSPLRPPFIGRWLRS
jgi:hypothetical protein